MKKLIFEVSLIDKNENEKQYGKILLGDNQTSFLQISLMEIGATVAQLVASVR